MLDRIKYTVFPIVLLLFCVNSSTYAGLYDWDIKGVNDTTRVEKVLQLTHNPSFTNTEVGSANFSPLANGSYSDPWSADGSWLVYTVRIDLPPSVLDDYPLYKIRPDGSSPTRLTGNGVDDSNASFASDGRIYFDRWDHGVWGSHIWRMEGDGSGQKNLSVVHGGDHDMYVRPSPDAQFVAYLDNTKNELKVARNDGTFPVTISGTQVINEPQHDWSPDSQWLAYKGKDTGQEWIYTVRRDGTDLTPLTRPPFMVVGDNAHLWPSWSPDGRQISYIWRVRDSIAMTYYYYLQVVAADDGLAQQNLDSATTAVLPGWQHISGPLSWSPDGKWIAYYKKFDAGGPYYHALFIAPSDGSSEPIQLTIAYNDYKSFWSPDGSRILFEDSGHSSSRDEDGYKDLLILKMKGNYGKFPWPMFMPAIISGNR